MDEITLEKNIKTTYNLRFIIHTMVTLAIAAGVAWFSNEIILEHAWNQNYFIFAGTLFGGLLLCSFLQRKKLYEKNRSMLILLACFLVSALLLLLSDLYVNLPIWLLGGIVAAALVNRNIGMLYIYFFVFHAIYLQGYVINGLVFHFVIATIICLFISRMKSFLSMLYMMAITGCAVVTASIIYNYFIISPDMMLDTLLILCTYMACILITMLLVLWFGGSVDKQEEAIEESGVNGYEYLAQMAEETAEKDAEIAAELACAKEEETAKTEELTEAESTELPDSMDIVTDSEPQEEVTEVYDYASLCKLSYDLMKQLRQANRSAYAQAVYLGKLSAEAAEAIQLNAELVKAAGMYKRIGKLRGDSKEDTLDIIREHSFPEPLIQLVEQLWNAEITSKESAVIKITEKVSNYYITMQNSTKKNTSIEKIVDTVLTKQMFQGEYNDSGLNVQECAKLRTTLVRLFEELKEQQAERSQKK